MSLQVHDLLYAFSDSIHKEIDKLGEIIKKIQGEKKDIEKKFPRTVRLQKGSEDGKDEGVVDERIIELEELERTHGNR